MKRTFTKYPSSYVKGSRYTDDAINKQREHNYTMYQAREKWKAEKMAEGKLSNNNSDSTGYWQAVMQYWPEDGSGRQEYYAFTTGYDRDEAKFNLYDNELEQCDLNDYMFCLSPISEEEYLDGVRRYNDGQRWR